LHHFLYVRHAVPKRLLHELMGRDGYIAADLSELGPRKRAWFQRLVPVSAGAWDLLKHAVLVAFLY